MIRWWFFGLNISCLPLYFIIKWWWCCLLIFFVSFAVKCCFVTKLDRAELLQGVNQGRLQPSQVSNYLTLKYTKETMKSLFCSTKLFKHRLCVCVYLKVSRKIMSYFKESKYYILIVIDRKCTHSKFVDRKLQYLSHQYNECLIVISFSNFTSIGTSNTSSLSNFEMLLHWANHILDLYLIFWNKTAMDF